MTTGATTVGTMTATTERVIPGDLAALEAVSAALGVELEDCEHRGGEPVDDGWVVGYRVRWRSPSGAVDDQTVYLHLDPRSGEREGVLRLSSDVGTLDVWVYPRDPELPALPAAVFPSAASVLLERLGLSHAALDLRVASYRPTRRAVVRMASDEGTTWLKIVRPHLTERLVEQHGAWGRSGIPVPQVVAWSTEGLIALEEARGVEAASALGRLHSSDVPDLVDALDELSRAVARVPSTAAARASLATRVSWYVRRCAALDPSSAQRVERLGVRIADLSSPGVGAAVTVHGDLHLAQVFVDPERPTVITGLIDIDTAGAGDPADDAAALWAHLAATMQGRDDRSTVAGILLDGLERSWTRPSDPGYGARVRAIAATHLLGHALSGSLSLASALRLADDLLA